MGKTAEGAVWLDKKLLSPYDYWQFWRNTNDKDVIRFLNYFTDIESEELEKVKSQNINDLKKLLADKTTAMLHGEKEASKARKTAQEVFSGHLSGVNIPSAKIQISQIEQNINIIDLVILSKLENSKSEIRRLIKGKAIKINNELITDDKYLVEKDLLKENNLILSIGKKDILN